MHLTRRVACAVTAGLIGAGPLALAAPSQAATTHKTYAVASPSRASSSPVGTRPPGRSPTTPSTWRSTSTPTSATRRPAAPGGPTTLLAQEVGSSTWEAVAESTTASGYFTDVRPTVNTTYKAVYSGYTDRDGDTYARVETATFTVEVGRRITFPVAGFVIKGKVTPDYAKRKIVIQVSKQQNKGFTVFRTIRTTPPAGTRSPCRAEVAPATGTSRSRATSSTSPTASCGRPSSADLTPRTYDDALGPDAPSARGRRRPWVDLGLRAQDAELVALGIGEDDPARARTVLSALVADLDGAQREHPLDLVVAGALRGRRSKWIRLAASSARAPR